jgi:hypothetical protein
MYPKLFQLNIADKSSVTKVVRTVKTAQNVKLAVASAPMIQSLGLFQKDQHQTQKIQAALEN